MSDAPPNPAGDADGVVPDATLLLSRAQVGDTTASEQLLAIVYEQLRATAGSYFRAQSSDHTLQPTALVHEAYLKLMGDPAREWDSRGHFCAVASIAMRQILRDHARAKKAAKRGGGSRRVNAAADHAATFIESPSGTAAIDLLQLDELLTELADTDQQGTRVVEMQYFGGMHNEQIAKVLGVSVSTVERAARRCLAWLRSQLRDDRQSWTHER